MTIAIMLGLLVVPCLILAGLGRVLPRAAIAAPLRGRMGLALVFLFTATGHFIRTGPMVEMLPPWVPARTAIVQATGALELLAAVGLLVPWPGVIRLTGIRLIAFLIAVFPANVYSTFTRAGLGGSGPRYLLIRTPLQLLLIGWAWWFAVRSPAGPAYAGGSSGSMPCFFR